MPKRNKDDCTADRVHNAFDALDTQYRVMAWMKDPGYGAFCTVSYADAWFCAGDKTKLKKPVI